MDDTIQHNPWFLLVVAGLIAVVAAFVVGMARSMASKARLRTAQTQGTITDIDDGGSGEFPIVTFTPGGAPRAREPVSITFTSSRGNTGGSVGDRVQVRYDPDDPDNADLSTLRSAIWLSRSLYGFALALGLTAVGLVWLAQQMRERDDRILAFLQAVRSGDPDALVDFRASDGQLDEAFLREVVAPSRRVEIEDDVFVGSDRACARGRITPGDVQLVLALVEQEGRWMISRAANRDPECEEHLQRSEVESYAED